jgi:hypothetical protein
LVVREENVVQKGTSTHITKLCFKGGESRGELIELKLGVEQVM